MYLGYRCRSVHGSARYDYTFSSVRYSGGADYRNELQQPLCTVQRLEIWITATHLRDLSTPLAPCPPVSPAFFLTPSNFRGALPPTSHSPFFLSKNVAGTMIDPEYLANEIISPGERFDLSNIYPRGIQFRGFR